MIAVTVKKSANLCTVPTFDCRNANEYAWQLDY